VLSQSVFVSVLTGLQFRVQVLPNLFLFSRVNATYRRRDVSGCSNRIILWWVFKWVKPLRKAKLCLAEFHYLSFGFDKLTHRLVVPIQRNCHTKKKRAVPAIAKNLWSRSVGGEIMGAKTTCQENWLSYFSNLNWPTENITILKKLKICRMKSSAYRQSVNMVM